MPEDELVDSTGTAEPATPVADASETPSESGRLTPEARSLAFSAMLGRTAEEAAPTEEEEAPPPVEPKPEKEAPQAPEPEGEDEGEEEEDDDVTLLTDDDIDKHKTAPKQLRAYAKKLTKKFGPILETVRELGGVEAVKRLDRLQTLVMSAPTRADAPEVLEYLEDLRKTNPQFATQLNTNVFYGALDEDPNLLDSVIRSQLGPNWTKEKIATVARLVDEGEIDLEAVNEERLDRLDPEERARREADKAREEARDAEIAELRKGQVERERLELEQKRKAEIEQLSKVFDTAREPVLRKFGYVPKEGDPDEIQAMREYQSWKVTVLASVELADHPLMRMLDRKLLSQERGDDYEWAKVKASHMVTAKTRELCNREAKLFDAFLRTYNQPVAANLKERRPEPLVDSSLAASRPVNAQPDEGQARLSPEERREAFRRRLEEQGRATGTAA